MVVTESERDGVVALASGPRSNNIAEALLIVCKKHARSLFGKGHVSGHRRHEMVSTLLRSATSVFLAVGSPGFFDQFSQNYGRTAGLCSQPFPLTRQQSNFASYYA
jgi:hypothetical protein